MAAETLSPEAVLARLPHGEPFRFVDRILEIDAQHVVAEYEWRADADFYRGHFPQRPITPGVLLVECMAQAGLVALGIYLLAQQETAAPAPSLTVFTDASIEFGALVEPGSRVRITSHKRFFRRRALRAEVAMHLADGRLACSGVLTGMMVPR